MLDGDDASFFAALFMPTSLVGFVFWVIAIVVMLFIVLGNEKECATMACPNGGHAELLDSRCLCVEKPVAK